jgi:hypothetical protein
MATVSWIASGAADWDTNADWSTGNVPGPSDDVIIGLSSSATTVTLDIGLEGGRFINPLQINPNDELSINGESDGDLIISNGMPNGNFGTLDIENNGLLRIDHGTVNNSGLILVKQTQSSGQSILFFADAGGTVTLNGAGMVVLGGNDQTLNAVIEGNGAFTSTLINDDNNISGTGTIGAGLNIVNHGTFETNNFLELGTMQIVGSAGGGSFDNDNLVIADPNGILILGTDGQTSKIINNDLIELQNSVPNTQSTIEIAGTLFLQNNQVLGLGSNIAGNVIVSDGLPAELILAGGTLGGVGQLGDDHLTLFIEAFTYVVSASGTMTFSPIATTIQPSGVLEAIGSVIDDFSTITNNGTVAALGGGEIKVFDNITNGNGGVINIGAGSEIFLEPNVDVFGIIQFTGSNATLALSADHRISNSIQGTTSGDSFDLTYEPFQNGLQAVWAQAGVAGTLFLEKNNTVLTTVSLVGQYTSSDFAVAQDANGNTLIKDTAVPPSPPPPPLSNTDLVSEVYIGYYNRSPDPTGMTFWLNGMANGATLAQVANDFANSSESTAIYPFLSAPNLANASSFVTQVYNNLLNRAPDSSGLQFWSQELQSGAVTPGGFILAVEQSVNQQTGTADAMTLSDKLTVAEDYVTRINAANVPFSQASAHGSLAPVTSDASTIATGEAVTTAYIGITPHLSSGLGLLS